MSSYGNYYYVVLCDVKDIRTKTNFNFMPSLVASDILVNIPRRQIITNVLLLERNKTDGDSNHDNVIY